MTKQHHSRRPIHPGEPDWLDLRAKHATLKRQIAERRRIDRELEYQQLQRLIAQTTGQRW
jgi:hypothetical protein